MSNPEPSIRINVDVTNPGQFFACCGLLELADRLWHGARGAFSTSGSEFVIGRASESCDGDARELLSSLASCPITSTMSEEQLSRLKSLLNQKKTTLTQQDLNDKLLLSELWNRERIRLNAPFNVWIDWWEDSRAGGSRFKTWAGKQFVIDLVRGMQGTLCSNPWNTLAPNRCLSEATSDGRLPLYFDADIGGQSSSIDVGFSLDSLDIRSSTRPLIELAAFVGLQRFRPLADQKSETFRYTAWTDMLAHPRLSAAEKPRPH
jgi:CRISPR-associated protein Csb3